MPQNISRRQLIATGAAGTAGALGLGACNATTALHASDGEQRAQTAGQESPDAPQGTPLYKKLKPFLSQQYSKNPPQTVEGVSKLQRLNAWMREQVKANFKAHEDYQFQNSVDPVAAEYFTAVELALEDLIAAGKIWEQVVQPGGPLLVVQDDRDKEIIVPPINPLPPGPGPSPGQEVRVVRPGVS